MNTNEAKAATSGADRYLDDVRACRFCGKHESGLLKYGARHYAHAACGFAAQGCAFLDNFTDWQCHAQVPYFAAKDAGCADELVKRAARYEASQR